MQSVDKKGTIMSEERKRYEGEEIQKGLEDFIDRELNLDTSSEKQIYAGRVEEDFAPELDLIGYDNSIHMVELEDAQPEEYDFVNIKRPSVGRGNPARRSERDEYARHETRSRDSRGRAGRNDYDDDYDDDYEERRPSRRRSERDYDEDEYEERRPSRKRSERDYDDDDYEERRPSRKRSGKKYSQERDDRRMSGKSDKKNRRSEKQARDDKKKKKKSKAKGFLIFLIILFLLIFGGLYMAVGKVYNKMTYEEAEGMSKEPYKENGVINVLLIGNDSRLGGDDGRSDAMILVSISDKTKTITMTSFLRDMYVDIPGHDGNRLNAAYAYGGPKLLMETIEANFDIPVHRYALVNFEAFANLVDAVGGIDLDVTNDEVQLINGYLMEYNQLRGENLDYDWLDSSASGVIHLNGAQALAYTRNRYIGTDFGRTERQRKVLSEVFKKAPAAMVTNGNGVIDGLFPNLTTNLKQRECYDISLNAWKFASYKLVQQYVPIDGSYTNATIRSMAVLQVDFDANKRFLKETLYGE